MASLQSVILLLCYICFYQNGKLINVSNEELFYFIFFSQNFPPSLLNDENDKTNVHIKPYIGNKLKSKKYNTAITVLISERNNVEQSEI